MCQIYGYCRISTAKQSIERQIRNIKAEYPTAFIIKEIFTGTTTEGRKEWNGLLKEINREIEKNKEQDITIVFDSVSRMSRNADEGFKLYQDLFHKGINLIFLKEPHINTETYKQAMSNKIKLSQTDTSSEEGELVSDMMIAINKYIDRLAKKQIKLAFIQSEKEVKDLQQRTKEGIKTAKLEGKQIGLKKGTELTTKKSQQAKEIILKHSQDFNGTLADNDVIKLCGISRNSYYKYKKELKNR